MKISKTHHKTKKGVIKRNPPKKNSSKKIVSYEGSWVNKEGKTVSFSLYEMEDIDYDETKREILRVMRKEHLNPLRNRFAKVGIKLHDFEYYSPKTYNYASDSMDLKISVLDRELLKRFIRTKRKEIQKMLDGNKSYDGYMATTSNDIDEVIEKIDNNFDVDTMIVTFIQLKYPIDQYDVFDNLVYELGEDEE